MIGGQYTGTFTFKFAQSVTESKRTCEILARYHAPGAGWYWNPHTAAINIPIYFLTYIFFSLL